MDLTKKSFFVEKKYYNQLKALAKKKSNESGTVVTVSDLIRKAIRKIVQEEQ